MICIALNSLRGDGDRIRNCMQRERPMSEIERLQQDMTRVDAQMRREGWRLVIASAASFVGTLALSLALLRYFDGLACR
jgi:hypothetical protein